MLDKDDITKSYGKISKKELLKELGFKEYQLVSFLNNQGIFREKYILVEDDEKYDHMTSNEIAQSIMKNSLKKQ